LCGLPIEPFINLLHSDNLYVDSEYELVDIVRKYIKFHNEKGEKLPIDPEKSTIKEVWSRLSEEEKKTRQKVYTAEVFEIARGLTK
jgi:hypothetical protein